MAHIPYEATIAGTQACNPPVMTLCESWTGAARRLQPSVDDRRPPTKKSPNRSAIVLRAGGTSGLYQRGIQFTAPNSAKARSFGSPPAKTPVFIPSSSTRRTPLSNASRRAMTALRCAGESASRSRNSAVPCSSSRIVWTNASISRRSLTSAGDAAGSISVEQLRQPIERVLVAREEDLLLVLEVVVEVPLLHVQRRGDLFDRGAVIAEPAERFRRAFQDVDPRRGLGIGVARAFPPRRRGRASPRARRKWLTRWLPQP